MPPPSPEDTTTAAAREEFKSSTSPSNVVAAPRRPRRPEERDSDAKYPKITKVYGKKQQALESPPKWLLHSMQTGGDKAVKRF